MKRYVFPKAALILVCRLEPQFVLLYKNIWGSHLFMINEYLQVTAKSERVCFCRDSLFKKQKTLFVFALGSCFLIPTNIRAGAHTADDFFLRAL